MYRAIKIGANGAIGDAPYRNNNRHADAHRHRVTNKYSLRYPAPHAHIHCHAHQYGDRDAFGDANTYSDEYRVFYTYEH